MLWRAFLEKIGLARPRPAPEPPSAPEADEPESAGSESAGSPAPEAPEAVPAGLPQPDDETDLASNMGDIVPLILEMAERPPEPAKAPAPIPLPEEAARPSLPPFKQRRVVISLLKGGVGKTTITCFLATALQKIWDETNAPGRVLVVDTDPQGSATDFFLEGEPVEPQRSLRALFAPYPFPGGELIRATRYPRIDLLPAHPEMANIAVSGDSALDENLAWYLEAVAGDYSLILLDTPPSDTPALRNALMAASGIYMPFDPSRQALNTLKQFTRTVKHYKERNHALRIYGVIFSRYYMKQRLDRGIYQSVSGILAASGLPLYRVPRRVAIAECYNDYSGFEALDPDKEKDAIETFRDIARQLLSR